MTQPWQVEVTASPTPVQTPYTVSRGRHQRAAADSWRRRFTNCTRVVVLPLLLSGCAAREHGFLAAAGPVAAAQRTHFLHIAGWVLVVILPLFIALPFVLWRYRLRNTSSTYRPNWVFSWTFEILIWGVPFIIVGILGWNLWRSAHQLDPYQPIASENPKLEIQVVSLDWKWLFIYPKQGVASVNEVVLPVNQPVHFRLTSGTVMQSFMIPRLGSQMYTMAGMVTELNLLATRKGTYRGQNTQYNGEGYAKQKFNARVVAASDFDDWVNDLRESGSPLNGAAYQRLAKRSVLQHPVRYGKVPDALFRQIVSRFKGTPSEPRSSATLNHVRGG